MRPFSRVSFLVWNKVGGPGEILPTLAAHKRPFPSMDPLVCNKIRASTKKMSHVCVCVNSLMSKECVSVPKGFPTITAIIRIYSSVKTFMLNKRRFVSGDFPTVGI